MVTVYHLSLIHIFSLKYHHSDASVLEAVFARGDRRLGEVMYRAFKKGCKFDSWDDQFHYDRWLEAFEECGLDPSFYANRRRSFDEILPWSHMNYCVSAVSYTHLDVYKRQKGHVAST